MAYQNLRSNTPVTGGQSTAVQNPNYGYGRSPGGPGPVGGLNQGVTGSPATGSNVGSTMPVGSPWANPAAGQQPGGSVMPVNQPRPVTQQPPQMTTMAMGEEGGSGGPAVTPTPGVNPTHPFQGPPPDIAYPGVNYGPRPTAPPPPPPRPPVIPQHLGQGAEQDYRLNKSELKNLSPQERQAANQKAHNLRAADNRHDVNHRNVILNNAANDRRADNRAGQPPMPPAIGGPHPFLPPGTMPGSQIGGGHLQDILKRLLGGQP